MPNLTGSDIEAIRQRVEKAILDAISGEPDQYGRELFNFTSDGEAGVPLPELIANSAAAGAMTIVHGLLAELDRRAELMRKAADQIEPFVIRHEFSPGIGSYDQCRVCGQCGTPVIHSPDCLIERLRVVGK